MADPYLETPHQISVLSSIETNEIVTFLVCDEKELQKIYPKFVAAQKMAILEIQTPREKNDIVLKQYFQKLRRNV